MSRNLLLPLTASLALVTPGLALAQDRPGRAPARAVSPLEAIDDVAARIAERAARSVVLVEVDRPPTPPRQITRAEREGMGMGGYVDPRYFTRPGDPTSGVVIGKNLIATASWNLEGNAAVTVVTASGKRLPATRLGRDENLDIALLEVAEDPDLVPLEPAAGAPVIGRFVLLVSRDDGNDGPLVTSGIVSALGRHRGDSFAHSARTSFRNNGGAIVDLDGKLLGIAVRHSDRARQGQSSGVGFGAPVASITASTPRLVKGEVVPRRRSPFLGIQGDPSADQGGVRIGAVLPETAAAQAGLRAGDIIRVFNNVEMRDFMHLREEIERLEVGSEIVITVKRGETEQDLRVKLGGRAEDE